MRVFKGHNSDVNSVAFSPDGQYALSGSDDETLRLWDVATGKTLRVFKGHDSDVNSVAFSPDGKYALSGCGSGALRLWNVATGETMRLFMGHSNSVNSVAFSPDGEYALSGSIDETLRLWVVATGKTLRVFKGHTEYVNSVAFSPDGQYALSASDDYTLRLWVLKNGNVLAKFASIDDEWITLTNKGYYNCSPDAEKYLHVRTGPEQIEFNIGNYKSKFYRPDIVAKILSGNKTYKIAKSKKIKKATTETVKKIKAPRKPSKIDLILPRNRPMVEEESTKTTKKTKNPQQVNLPEEAVKILTDKTTLNKVNIGETFPVKIKIHNPNNFQLSDLKLEMTYGAGNKKSTFQPNEPLQIHGNQDTNWITLKHIDAVKRLIVEQNHIPISITATSKEKKGVNQTISFKVPVYYAKLRQDTTKPPMIHWRAPRNRTIYDDDIRCFVEISDSVNAITDYNVRVNGNEIKVDTSKRKANHWIELQFQLNNMNFGESREITVFASNAKGGKTAETFVIKRYENPYQYLAVLIGNDKYDICWDANQYKFFKVECPDEMKDCPDEEKRCPGKMNHYGSFGAINNKTMIDRDLDSLGAALSDYKFMFWTPQNNVSSKPAYFKNSDIDALSLLRGELYRYLEQKDGQPVCLLVYLSGHGMELQGQSYFIPRLETESSPARLYETSKLVSDLSSLNDTRRGHKILLINDSCHSGREKVEIKPEIKSHTPANFDIFLENSSFEIITATKYISAQAKGQAHQGSYLTQEIVRFLNNHKESGFSSAQMYHALKHPPDQFFGYGPSSAFDLKQRENPFVFIRKKGDQSDSNN